MCIDGYFFVASNDCLFQIQHGEKLQPTNLPGFSMGKNKHRLKKGWKRGWFFFFKAGMFGSFWGWKISSFELFVGSNSRGSCGVFFRQRKRSREQVVTGSWKICLKRDWKSQTGVFVSSFFFGWSLGRRNFFKSKTFCLNHKRVGIHIDMKGWFQYFLLILFTTSAKFPDD